MGFSATVVLVLSNNVMKNSNHHTKIPNIFAFINLVQNVFLIMICLVKAVQDDIYAKTVPT